MTALIEAKEMPEFVKGRPAPYDTDLIDPFMDYEEAMMDLGIAKRFYQTDNYLQGKSGEYHAIEWVVLTEEAAQTPRAQLRRKTRGYAKELKETIGALELPFRVHAVLVRPEGEDRLRDHLKRNDIRYSRIDAELF